MLTLMGVGPLTGGRAGAALMWADFNGDGFGDLAVGVPDAFVLFEEPLTCINTGIIVNGAGAVQVFYGSSTGLKGAGAQFFQEGPTGGCPFGDNPKNVGLSAKENDHFGSTLAAGHFHGGAAADLVIGVPFKDLEKQDVGVVFIVPGGATGLRGAGAQQLGQDVAGVGGTAEAGDLFGWTLAVGDFDGDGRADLAIGSPGEDVGAITDAGLVTVIYGSSGGPNLTRTQNWTQDSSGILDTAEVGDQFGYALSAWDYGRGSQSDLAIGVPFEDVVSALDGTQQVDAGAVNVIYGSATTGLSATGNQFWHQDSPGIKDVAQPGDRFGSALY